MTPIQVFLSQIYLNACYYVIYHAETLIVINVYEQNLICKDHAHMCH